VKGWRKALTQECVNQIKSEITIIWAIPYLTGISATLQVKVHISGFLIVSGTEMYRLHPGKKNTGKQEIVFQTVSRHQIFALQP
jgi:hypothetical protein